MGFFDSLRNAISGEDKPKEFEATFVEPKLGMTLASGQQDQAIVKAGGFCKASCLRSTLFEAKSSTRLLQTSCRIGPHRYTVLSLACLVRHLLILRCYPSLKFPSK